MFTDKITKVGLKHREFIRPSVLLNPAPQFLFLRSARRLIKDRISIPIADPEVTTGKGSLERQAHFPTFVSSPLLLILSFSLIF
jgi:hypothetical protein